MVLRQQPSKAKCRNNMRQWRSAGDGPPQSRAAIATIPQPTRAAIVRVTVRVRTPHSYRLPIESPLEERGGRRGSPMHLLPSAIPQDHPFPKRGLGPPLLNVAMRIPAKGSQIAEQFLWEAFRKVWRSQPFVPSVTPYSHPFPQAGIRPLTECCNANSGQTVIDS